jgi:hypothetical protein
LNTWKVGLLIKIVWTICLYSVFKPSFNISYLKHNWCNGHCVYVKQKQHLAADSLNNKITTYVRFKWWLPVDGKRKDRKWVQRDRTLFTFWWLPKKKLTKRNLPVKKNCDSTFRSWVLQVMSLARFLCAKSQLDENVTTY